MPRRAVWFLLCCIWSGSVHAQDLAEIEIHGFVTQGFLFSSRNNYLTMNTSSGSLRWTDGALSVSDTLTDSLRVGLQLHMYELGQLGGPNVQVDWASGDYRINDRFGIRAGKVKTVIGLFNDAQDIDALFLWSLLPQSIYPVDDKSFFLSHVGGELYGGIPLGGNRGRFQYDGYAGQVTLDSSGGFVKILADDGIIFSSPPTGKIYGGDLRWDSLQGLVLGTSAYVQSADGKGLNGGEHLAPFFANGQYARYQKRRFYFAGEYRRTPPTPVVTIGTFVFRVPLDQRAWFAMGSFRLVKNLQLGTYYSHYVLKGVDASLPQDFSKDFVVSARYDLNSYFYLKLEDHFLHGTALGYYSSTNPSGLQPNSNILAARIGFSF